MTTRPPCCHLLWLSFSSVAILSLLASCRSIDAHDSNAPIVIKIAAFNDFHGHLNPPSSPTRVADPRMSSGFVELPTGGAAFLSALVAQVKAENPLNAVVAAGDLVGGAPLVSSLFHQEPSIEVLNRMGLEFSCVGNHEFDAGRLELLRMQNGGCAPGDGKDTCRNGSFGGAHFRYLAANVLDRTTGKPMLPAYAVKEFRSPTGLVVPVALIGLVTRDTPRLVIPARIEGLDFADEADTANALVPQLRARGVETIVVLIHEGGTTEQQSFDDATCPGFSGRIRDIVERLDPAIDLVVSGHTHRAYICRHAGRLVTSAGSEGRFLTDIDLDIDPVTKDVTQSKARQLAVVNDAAPNPLPDRYPTLREGAQVAALVDFYNRQAAPFAQREVGRISADITRQPDAAGESAMGDLIADAQLAATRRPGEGGAQIAFMNRGGMRADLRANRGVVTYSDLFSVHPFGNGLVTITLNGRQIHELLEQQWSAANSILQVSDGFSYAWDGAAPVGQRVAFSSIRLNGEPLDRSRTYRVTVNEFLALGGDGFTVLAEGGDHHQGVVDVEALEAYVSGLSTPLAPALRRRITRLDAQSSAEAAIAH